ncbi:MAG: hypothetical protein A2144_11025 [Chloroflexi bacterium RBG_16_50_9]|nr:MAG: hypothetical protein A2144_11025 [Chloroflexi bacterium RBG_16_50_9]
MIIVIGGLVFGSCSTATTTPAPTTAPAPAPTTAPKPAPTTAPAPAPTTVQPQYGGTLVWVRNTGIVAIGAPQDIPTQTHTFPLTSPVLETLVLTDNKEDIVPWLADSVTTSPDGKTITFKLKTGIKFHDGTNFNAAAVKYNLEAVKNAKASGTAVLENVISYDVVDDYTIRVNLKTYDARFLLALAQSGIGVMASPTALAKPTTPENAGKDHLVGTGPFKFDSWAKDQFVKMVKNPDYWQKGRPYLDAIEIRNNPNVTTSIMSLKAKEVNMVENIDPADYVQLGKEGYAVGIPTTLAFVFSFITDSANPNSPFAKQQVREALEYAIDKKSMTEGLGKGTQNPAYQLAAPKDAWYIQGFPERTYNVAKAKQLLTEAGYPTGFKTVPHSDVRRRADELVAIQSYFKEIGIETTLDVADVARATTFVQSTGGWDGILVPGFPNWSSFTSWTNRYLNPTLTYPSAKMPPGWTDGWNKVIAEPDFSKRVTMMKDLLKPVYEQALINPWLWDAPRYVTDGKVMDMAWDARNTNGYFDAVNVWIKK